MEAELFIKVFVEPAKSAEPPKNRFVWEAIAFKTFPEASRVEILSGGAFLITLFNQLSSISNSG